MAIETVEGPTALEKHLGTLNKETAFKCILYKNNKTESLLGLDLSNNRIFHINQFGRFITATAELVNAIQAVMPNVMIEDISRQDFTKQHQGSFLGEKSNFMHAQINHDATWTQGAMRRIEFERAQLANLTAAATNRSPIKPQSR